MVERRVLAALQHQRQQLAANPIMKAEGFSCRVSVLRVADQALLAASEISSHQVRLIEVAADLIGRFLGLPPLRLSFSEGLPRGLILRFSPALLSPSRRLNRGGGMSSGQRVG